MRQFLVKIDDGLYHIIRQLAKLQFTYRGDNEDEVIEDMIRRELVRGIYERLTQCPALLENARVHFSGYENPSRLYTDAERYANKTQNNTSADTSKQE